MESGAKDALLSALGSIIEHEAPGLVARSMYGGMVYERVPGVPKSSILGIFAAQGHVGLEFTHGAALPDPGRLLEGGGRLRRHLKLRTLDDLSEKNVASFIREAARANP